VYSLEKIFAHDDVIKFATMIGIIITKGVKVVYIIGNHDSRVHEEAIKNLLGSQVEVFQYLISNKSLPVGYYATRVDHTYDIGFSHSRRDSL